MSGAAARRPLRAAYRAKPGGIKLAAILAPLIAALIMTAVLWLMFTPRLLVSLSPQSVWEMAGLLFLAVLGTLYSLSLAVVYSYLVGGPVMAALWFVSHRLGLRGPFAMGAIMGLAGMVVGYLILNLLPVSSSSDDQFSLAMAGAGLIAGAAAGVFISARAYERIAPDSSEVPPS